MGAYTRVMSEEHTSPLWARKYDWKSQAWREDTLPGSLSSVQWWHSLCWWYGDHTSADFLIWFLGRYPLYSIWEPICKKNPVGKICPQQPEPSCLVPIAPTLRCFHLVFLQDHAINPTGIKHEKKYSCTPRCPFLLPSWERFQSLHHPIREISK